MKNIIKFAGVAALAVVLAQTVQAVPITGSITFAGGVNLNTSSAGTATAVTAWTGSGGVGQPFVIFSTLSAGAVAPLTTVTFTAPWNFNSGAISGFWSVGGYTFNLISSAIFSQGGSPASVTVTGTGTLIHAGFDNTIGTWSFSTQDPSSGTPANFSFSAASGTVPDGGATVMLLGIALSGAALLRKKLTA